MVEFLSNFIVFLIEVTALLFPIRPRSHYTGSGGSLMRNIKIFIESSFEVERFVSDHYKYIEIRR